MAPLLELRDADAAYAGRPVLQGISLSLHAGERVSVLGKSGSGKSTLLSLLYARLAQQAALVPQAASLVQTLSVFHNVYMGRLDRHSTLRNLRMLAWPARAEVAAVAATLASVGLEDKLFARAGTLSGGQQQRASMARALYNGRPVIIGDEPVSALDQIQAASILRLLGARHETLVLTMHDVPLALACSDRIIMLQAGRLVLDAPTSGMSAAGLMRYYA